MGETITPGLLSQEFVLNSEIAPLIQPQDLFRDSGSSKPKKFRRGENIFHQGDPVGGLYIVQKGIAKEFLTCETGEEYIAEFVTRRNPRLLGLEAIMDGEPLGYSAEAVIPVVAQYIPRNEIHAMIRTNPRLGEALLLYFSHILRQKREKYASMVFLNADARLATALLDAADQLADYAENKNDLPEISHLTQEDLAAMIGGSRTSVCKLLGYWTDKGYVSRNGRRIIIEDQMAIQNIGANEAVPKPFPPIEEKSTQREPAAIGQRRSA